MNIDLIETGLDEVQKLTSANEKRIEQLFTNVHTAVNVLSAIPTQYGALNTEINNLDGSDAYNAMLKAKKNQLLNEYQKRLAYAQALKTAMEAVEKPY